MNRIRIILADDHVVVRRGLRSLIDQQPDLQVVAESDDGLDLLVQVDKHLPQVVLVDIKMPRLNGIDAAEEIRRLHPETQVVILSMHSDRAYIERAIQAGVKGYILKDEDTQEMVTAIHQAALGRLYLSPVVSRQLPGQFAPGQELPQPIEQLTLRERQVFQLVAEGRTNGAIASLLGISVRTVEGHRAHLKTKLGLKTHVDFARFALQHGILVDGK